MEEFIFFHDFALVILVLILGIVGFIIVAALTNSAIRTNMLEGSAGFGAGADCYPLPSLTLFFRRGI